MMSVYTAVLPPIYKRMNRDCYLDPIRGRLIFITPEETIRQRTVSYILNELHVPKEMIKVEVRLSEYGVKTRARADIIIEEYNEKQDQLSPLVVIECKAPEIILGDNDLEQVWRYADLINAPFCVVTNGYEIICYYYDSRVDRYKEIEEFPEYKDMVLRRFQPASKIEKLPRLTLAEIKKHPDVYFVMLPS